MLVLDEWQKEFINTDSDKVLVSGRQTGKSEAAAYDNALYALQHRDSTCLIVSRTERQANELLIKVLNVLHDLDPKNIARGKDKPITNRVRLKNNSQILSLPTGIAGEGIRFLTCNKITVDEAQLVPDDVFAAITPMLLTTGGKLSLLGTPQGKSGYFWKAYENLDNIFKVFHINSEDVIKNRPFSEMWPEQRRNSALEHLRKEKLRMSEKQYMQEYLGIFIEDLSQYFSDELIKACCILKRPEVMPKEENYMGVDIARMGGDEITYEILHRRQHSVHQIENIVKRKQYTTQTEEDILALAESFNLEKIGIDAGSGSLGVGIFDRLMQNPKTKRKVIPMNNRKISLDREGKKLQRIFKEDLYENLLAMMEKKEILLLDDDEVTVSMKSVQIEYQPESSITKVRISGNYTHIAEGLIRAAWLINKEKVNKVWFRSF